MPFLLHTAKTADLLISFDTSLPTCAQGNLSDEFETAAMVAELKKWAQSLCSLGIDAINSVAFASCTNPIEFHDISGALELVLLARCKNYRCEQLALMVQALDDGLVHRIPDDEPTNRSTATDSWARHPVVKALFRIQCGGFRASFVHLM
jgi:hypothetical protein